MSNEIIREFDYQLASAIKKHQSKYKYDEYTKGMLMIAVIQEIVIEKKLETVMANEIDKAIEKIWEDNYDG